VDPEKTQAIGVANWKKNSVPIMLIPGGDIDCYSYIDAGFVSIKAEMGIASIPFG
jgi:hypothetical protein